MTISTNKTTSRVANLIIAGTVKAGTTSLFSYLLSHEEVCGSLNKETCYFLPKRYGGHMQSWRDYECQFNHCGNEKYILEATPGYFEGGERLAASIKEPVGDNVKIIIALRNPTARLHSFFKYKKAQVELDMNISMSDYIEICSIMTKDSHQLQDNDRYWGIDGGRYINYLPGWFSVIDPANIKIIFFDDIVSHPEQVMIDLCEWLDISPDVYRNMRFVVENKSIMYKFDAIHKLAIRTNKKLEPYFHRVPFVKKWIRDVYYFINGEPSVFEEESENEKECVEALYLDDNRALVSYLQDKGYTDFPAWLSVHVEAKQDA